MKKIILITGDLATGKSTFAHILSKRYGAPLFFKDKIKEILCDAIGFSSREENIKLSVATMNVMTYNFEVLALSDQDLILEANFKSYEMKRIEKIAKEKGYDILTLVLTADMDIIYKRFVNRIENENRHPVHICGFDGYESLKNYIELGRKQECFGRVIQITADDFSYQCDEDILSEIDAFMETQNEDN